MRNERANEAGGAATSSRHRRASASRSRYVRKAVPHTCATSVHTTNVKWAQRGTSSASRSARVGRSATAATSGRPNAMRSVAGEKRKRAGGVGAPARAAGADGATEGTRAGLLAWRAGLFAARAGGPLGPALASRDERRVAVGMPSRARPRRSANDLRRPW